MATDGDTGLNGEITYSLQAKVDEDDIDLETAAQGQGKAKGQGHRHGRALSVPANQLPFHIDARSGMIFVEGLIDRESRSRYSFLAVATDKGNPPTESVVDVDVNVMDVSFCR